MLDDAPYEGQERQRYLTELRTQFVVGAWETPGKRAIAYESVPGAPSWWAGDEEASQSFLAAMGVSLPDG